MTVRLPGGSVMIRAAIGGGGRIPWLVMGDSGVFALEACDGCWTLGRLAALAVRVDALGAGLAGYEGPLNRCSIYDNKEAGKRLQAMLAMGASRPWQDALEALTGSREMDASAILDFYAPLKTWLDEQNTGKQCGW